VRTVLFCTVILISSALLCVKLAAQPHSIPPFTSLKLCYEEQELAPYFLGTGPMPPAENPGIFVELMQILESKIPGLKVEFHRVPWKRCLNELKNNQSDVVIAGFKPARDSIGHFPKLNGVPDSKQALLTSQYCLFTHSDSPLSWNGQEFKQVPDKPIAVPQGYSIVEFLEAHQLPLVMTNSSHSAMELLARSVTAGAVTYCESGGSFLWQNANRQLNIIAHSPVLVTKHGYLLFSKAFAKQHPELVSRIWQVASQIRQQYFSELLEKYEALKMQ